MLFESRGFEAVAPGSYDVRITNVLPLAEEVPLPVVRVVPAPLVRVPTRTASIVIHTPKPTVQATVPEPCSMMPAKKTPPVSVKACTVPAASGKAAEALPPMSGMTAFVCAAPEDMP